jgi:two-component system, cell cycle response regulator
MTTANKALLCVEPSLAQQALFRRIAEKHGLEFCGCSGETEALAALENGKTFAVMVIAHQLDDGDSLQVIETARLSPRQASLPIAFVLGDRKPRQAQNALNAGATEIFLRTEVDALINFVGEWAAVEDAVRYGGKVLLLEDSDSHAQYVKHLCQALGMEVDIVQDVASAEKRFGAGNYQLVIVDVVLNDTKSGITFVKDIRQEHGARQSILVMSSFDDLPRRLLAMKSGADDFISKPFTPEEFVWRVKKVMESHAGRDLGNKPVTTDAQSLQNSVTKLLSPRESEVFQMLITGKSDHDMAGELGISFWTVRGHIQQIYNKTGAINRRELMARFIASPRK